MTANPRKFVDLIEGLAMACDGPVTPFLDELDAASSAEKERFITIIKGLYALAKGEQPPHSQTLTLKIDASALKLPTVEELRNEIEEHGPALFGPYGYLCGHLALDEEHHSYEQDPITPTDEYWSIPLFSMAPPPAPGRYPAPTANMAAALAAIAAERRRQIEEEGYDASHDDMETKGQLAIAAACYLSYQSHLGSQIEEWWPWDFKHWKPSADRKIDLIKAGALIVAELERIARAEAVEPFAWCKEAAKDASS